jgi:hypothetical protein
MIGRLDTCVLLTYRAPANRLQPLVPAGLQPVTYKGFGFFNVVACHIDRMRPSGVPRFLGLGYWHVAYRIQVRAALAEGSQLGGLFFLRSDVDRRLMALPGNLFTDFCFHHARVRAEERGQTLDLRVTGTKGGQADAVLRVEPREEDQLAPGSIYASIEERESMLKYSAVALSVDAGRHCLRVAEVKRDESQWSEAPLRVLEDRWAYLDHLGQQDRCLERATRIAPIDYRWGLGRCESLT